MEESGKRDLDIKGLVMTEKMATMLHFSLQPPLYKMWLCSSLHQQEESLSHTLNLAGPVASVGQQDAGEMILTHFKPRPQETLQFPLILIELSCSATT